MYEVRELAFGDTRRLFEYKLAGLFGAGFNLKGFDYPWILSSHQWRRGERVLDVGAGYSTLPRHIAETYGCEVWAVDDFGASADDPFWKRGRDPVEHIRAHREVRYVLERLGDPLRSSLPVGYFDCIYSASTLEHVPPPLVKAVWRHMDLLLRPGGEMLHAVDMAFPTRRGVLHVAMAVGLDILYPLLPVGPRQRFTYKTPKAYARSALSALGVPHRGLLSPLEVVDMLLDPEIVVESPENTFNRIVKDGMTDVRHVRVGSLLFNLKKVVTEA